MVLAIFKRQWRTDLSFSFSIAVQSPSLSLSIFLRWGVLTTWIKPWLRCQHCLGEPTGWCDKNTQPARIHQVFVSLATHSVHCSAVSHFPRRDEQQLVSPTKICESSPFPPFPSSLCFGPPSQLNDTTNNEEMEKPRDDGNNVMPGMELFSAERPLKKCNKKEVFRFSSF